MFRAVLLALGASQGHATAYLFTSAGAGTFGITADGGGLLTLALNGSVAMPNNTQAGIGLASGDKLQMNGGTVSGQIDFSDNASTSTGGSCPLDAGGICKVNTVSSIAAGSSITGLTQLNASAVGNAITEWTNLTSGWSGGTTNGNVSLASTGSICVGDAFTGCSLANLSTASATTRTVNGVVQTAYVLNISSTSIGGTITIKGNGSALVILQYSNSTKLTTGAGSRITLTGGITNDQVLLDDTGTGGIDTSAGFDYTGAMAVSPTGGTTNLNALVMNGRLFVSNTASTTVNLGNGFSMSTAPEPATVFLIGGALVGIALISKKKIRS
jgi:hypothetical protein